MEITYSERASNIREAFLNRFVMPWETYQKRETERIARTNKDGHPITKEWFERSCLWDRTDSDFSSASMKAALDYLRERPGQVLVMTEKQEKLFLDEETSIDTVAAVNACSLADRIEHDWYESYRLAENDMFIPNAIAEDLYVFDDSLEWCVVFTHETTDWESEKNEDMMTVAKSRYCLLFRGKNESPKC